MEMTLVGIVSGHITTLGLNDGKGSQGTSTVGLVHLGGTLEETRVQVENVTGVGLTSGGDDGGAETSDGRQRPAWTDHRR
jgi:hypothetical protein